MSAGPDLDDLPHAIRLWTAGTWAGRPVYGHCALCHADRRLQRRRLETAAGEGFYVYLDALTELRPGDGFELADGRMVEIAAAPEAVLVVTGPDLAAIGWHLGSRHLPCQTGPGRILVLADAGVEALLRGLGAEVVAAQEPFLPIAGAADHGHLHGHAEGVPAGGGPLVFVRTKPAKPVVFDRPASGPFGD